MKTPRGVNNTNKNGMWKGDAVGYRALHSWIERHFVKTGICEHCLEKKLTEWANKTGLYLRDRSDWEELCRKCHMAGDGRTELLIKNQVNGYDNWKKRDRDQYGKFI